MCGEAVFSASVELVFFFDPPKKPAIFLTNPKSPASFQVPQTV